MRRQDCDSREMSAEEKGWIVDSGPTTNMADPRLVPGVRNRMDDCRPLNTPS